MTEHERNTKENGRIIMKSHEKRTNDKKDEKNITEQKMTKFF